MAMSAASLDALLEEFIKNSAENGDPSNISKSLTIGMVVDTDDPLQQGRLKIFCPALNDSPKKLLHIPWASYVSPFSGSVNNESYARGHIPGQESTTGSVHYGFWGLPEIGAHVIVGCVNGDTRRRFYLGSIPNHQETHTWGHGRYEWSNENGTPNGPLSSDKKPIQPLYDNFTKAFVDRESPEWQTRGADFQLSAILDDPPSPNKRSYVDDDYDDIVESIPHDWVKEVIGAHGYDWTGYKNLGAILAARTYGFVTPGFHGLTMDDRPFNSRIRLRTAAGHQIILDDTNERMYFSTYEGNNWIELDRSGNIDFYSKRRFSVHSEEDINFSADGTIRFKGNKGLHFYAGDTRGQSPLSAIPNDGEIRFHAADDIHMLGEKSFRGEFAQDYTVDIANDLILQAEGTIEFSDTSDSNIIQASGGNITIQGDNDVQFVTGSFTTTILDMRDNMNTLADDHNTAMGQIESQTSASGLQRQSDISDSGISDLVSSDIADFTKKALWTNRVPEHEPWARVLKQDSDDNVNEQNDGYKNNVDWIDQFDDQTSPDGIEPIGKVEGDETIDRTRFWRR